MEVDYGRSPFDHTTDWSVVVDFAPNARPAKRPQRARHALTRYFIRLAFVIWNLFCLPAGRPAASRDGLYNFKFCSVILIFPPATPKRLAMAGR